MSRLQSTSAASGTSPYTFPYNPAEYDNQDSYNAASVEILHGAPAWHQKKWDGRPRILRWFAVGATTTSDPTGRNQMLSTMRAWKGTTRYFNFQNIARINESWPSNTTWNRARVIDVRTNLRRGGEMRYDTVELIIQPESQ